MAARRARKVTLAGGRATKVAGREDATPERLAHAGRDGAAGVDGQGVRRLADAFDVLRNRQLLDRENPTRNALLWEAGERFRRHWHLGRLDGLSGFDFTRDSVDGTGPGATTPTEAALRHRDALRNASGAVGARLLPYLSGIVVESRTVAALIPLVTDTGHARTAEALILERLRESLHRLCDHWGMRPGPEARPIRAWRDRP